MNQPEVLEIRAPNMPHLRRIDQFFGVWSMNEPQFRTLVACMRTTNWAQHFGDSVDSSLTAAQAGVRVQNGVAILEVTGVLNKYPSSVGETSTTILRHQLRTARSDERVRAIALLIDSPGGAAKGVKDLHEDLVVTAKSMPVWSYIEDMGASAAYFLASATDRIACGQTAVVGGIGTFMVAHDASKAASDAGIVVHVIKAGEFKGMGTEGTEITEDQLNEIQRLVDHTNTFFLRAVQDGRELNTAALARVSDGRVHIGERAQALGLVDGIETFDTFIAALAVSADTFKAQNDRARQSASVVQGEPVMAHDAPDKTGTGDANAPVPVDVGTLQKEIPEADNDFVVKCLSDELTLEQSKSAWIKHQDAQLAANRKELADAKADAKAPEKAGATAIVERSTDASAGDSDPIEVFDTEVRRVMQQRQLTRTDACRLIARLDPEMHADYLLATQSTDGGRGMAKNKAELRRKELAGT